MSAATDALLAILEGALLGTDRNLQTRIGPSGLGTTCDRCLVHGLAETPQQQPDHPPWYAGIGTCVHEYFGEAVTRHEVQVAMRGESTRFLPENRVSVGYVIGVGEVTGSSDVFDTVEGEVIDYKILGKASLDKLARGDLRPIYLRQAMLYGLGWRNAGYTVNNVTIFGIPRNAARIADGTTLTLPYDEEVARDTLARANVWGYKILTSGLDATLAEAGEHNGKEFSCGAYGDYAPALPDIASYMG